jgi:hypothetical protein
MDTQDALDPEPMIISLRAYAESAPRFVPPGGDGDRKIKVIPRPSPWSLTFDTETTTDAGQGLRFGSYQVRYDGELREAGLFYEPAALTGQDLVILTDHATAHGLKLLTRDAFVEEVFYGIGYELRATIIGLNLPFDLARLAIGHGSARGDMRGGFSLKLSTDKRRPPVQVKHISQRTSLIRFAAPFRQRKARSERKRQDYVPVRRGFFVDIRTFAGALFARSFGLASLAEFLGVPHPKLETDEHGSALTDAYVAYAVRDVQTTWECYAALVERYQTFSLADPPHAIFSEASIGKAYLKAMGVKPWLEVQKDAPPPRLLATIMSAYFGGRSEVRIRRELRQVVLCDFLSMYPTVCTLMRLWPFVIADGMTWRDATEETRALLSSVALADLQQPETWRTLLTLVEVQPDDDVFPVRAHYQDEGQATIGLNHPSADRPLWFTLADCIASKLMTGRAPNIVQAMTFEAGEPQDDLRQVMIAGNRDYAVDPIRDDFYKRLIELRQGVKRRRNRASGAERDALDAEQNALKIAANASSYGVFVEINVKERAKRGKVTVHTAAADPYAVETGNDEEPGRFFHPLLATLITGAARLMLAITERLILDEGLEWAFCDTDSMAIAKPEAMDIAEFQIRVDRVVDWFAGLNPYDFGGSILKVEDQNFSLDDPGKPERLYCWAVSAKRYVLFNLDSDGRPVLRKASAHGLGHIRAPYDAAKPAKTIPAPIAPPADIGVEHWQHDLWWMIASAAIEGHPDQVDLSYHAALDEPAVSRYAATTPPLLKWFKASNQNQPYARQVKPFGFLLSLFADPFSSNRPMRMAPLAVDVPTQRGRPHQWRPVAPFDQDHAKALKAAFDRETGEPVPIAALRTVAEVIGLYHLHPESKFLNGDYLNRGTTRRRHVRVTGVRHIGKEANRWEEQHFLGLDEDAQPDYGVAPDDMEARLMVLRATVTAFGMRALARRASLSPKVIKRALRSAVFASPPVIERLSQAAAELENEALQRAAVHADLLQWAARQVEAEGLAAFARRVGGDSRNLGKALVGSRPLSAGMAARLIAQGDVAEPKFKPEVAAS